MTTTTVVKTYGVTIENSSLAFSTPGVTPGQWLQNFASDAWNAVKAGVQSALDLGRRMLEGGREVLSAIARGDIGIFLNWFKEDPKAAIAGGAAVGLAGWLIAGVTGIGTALSGATSVASSAIGSMWATLGSYKLGGITLGAMLPTLQQAILGGSRVVINTDWAQSDASILAQLQGQYKTFLENVGEGAGRLIVGLAFGGGKANPKMTINITAAAALSIVAEREGSRIEEEMIEALSELANTFVRYATNLLGKLGYLQFRKWARMNVRTGIEKIDKKIQNWGLEEGSSWSIAQQIQTRIDSIEETNPELHALIEGVYSGLGEGFSDFVAFV
ncbi:MULTISPECIES: hypothetical protein [unclassified Microcoleus]|uniref:hypothetical protein n=1 Tax=unclassified Microcoleus TaxID=2642155 RepID=UPI002FD27A37